MRDGFNTPLTSAARRRSPPSAPTGGFTLLEVLLAMTIFTITISALFVTFRTGIKAWQTGHASSEIFQTARIVQELMIRDFHNLAYRQDDELNTNFRGTLDLIADIREADLYGPDYIETRFGPGFQRRYDALRGGQNIVAPEPEVDGRGRRRARRRTNPLPRLEDLLPPIDMAFVGSDNELTDTVEFARFRQPRFPDDVDVWGLMRVKYYVEDGILYRQEMSPQGYRPNETIDRARNVEDRRETVGRLFYPAGFREQIGLEEDRLFVSDGEISALPDVTDLSEPLCQGVAIFNITYGHFKFEQWNEVDSWDSGQYKYRFERGEEPVNPLSRMLDERQEGIDTGDASGGGNESNFTPRRRRSSNFGRVRGQMIRFQTQPDNLPGYVAIQLGLRDPLGQGRIRSFTFFVSFPMANETFDTTNVDTPGGLRGYGSARPSGDGSNLFVGQ